MNTNWKLVDQTANHLRDRLGPPPSVLLVLGSGLGQVGSGLEDERSLSFAEVPNWPKSTVEGHAGELKRGRLAGVEVMIQQGRIHLYEGYGSAEVALPVRAIIAYGASVVVLTNAAGGINPTLRPGQLMMIEDHINLTGHNPLTGKNDNLRGPRFPDMTEVYSRKLRAYALNKAAEYSIPLSTGVYAGMIGPCYETPAETNMLKLLGADAVGMSTVIEAIAARHMGAEIAGISCITNQASTSRGAALTHEEVQVFAAKAADDMTRLIAATLEYVRGD